MKFKVGDKVRIVKNVWAYPEVALVEVGIGEEHTIVACYPGDRYPYALDAYRNYTWCDEELELVEDKKVFTKSDLKNGDIVVCRNGNVHIAIVDNGVLISKNGFNRLADYREDLTEGVYDEKRWDIVKVIRPTEDYHNQFITAEREGWGDLVYDRERDTKPLYNGKVVCINKNVNQRLYTIGKIYQFEDGQLTADNGKRYPESNTHGRHLAKIYTFEDWKEWSTAEWIEIKE